MSPNFPNPMQPFAAPQQQPQYQQPQYQQQQPNGFPQQQPQYGQPQYPGQIVSTAPMSMDLDDFVQGGLLSDVDVLFSDFVFAGFDYAGTVTENVLAVKAAILVLNDKGQPEPGQTPNENYWSCGGKLSDVMISTDGYFCMPGPGKTAMTKNSNWYYFLKNIEALGMPKGYLKDGNLSKLRGLRAHIIRQAAPKREGLVITRSGTRRNQQGGSDDATVMFCNRVIWAPWPVAAGKGKQAAAPGAVPGVPAAQGPQPIQQQQPMQQPMMQPPPMQQPVQQAPPMQQQAPVFQQPNPAFQPNMQPFQPGPGFETPMQQPPMQQPVQQQQPPMQMQPPPVAAAPAPAGGNANDATVLQQIQALLQANPQGLDSNNLRVGLFRQFQHQPAELRNYAVAMVDNPAWLQSIGLVVDQSGVIRLQ